MRVFYKSAIGKDSWTRMLTPNLDNSSMFEIKERCKKYAAQGFQPTYRCQMDNGDVIDISMPPQPEPIEVTL